MPQPTVFIRQQEEHFVRLLAAQAQLYTDYERNLALWVVASTIIAILGTGGVAISPKFFAVAALLVALALFGEHTLLQTLTDRRREAARIQEQYDCELLEIPWNPTDSRRPHADLIVDAAQRHLAKAGEDGYTRLRTWYDQPIADRPLREARILCQRYNLFWDSDLRTRWSWMIGLALAVLVIAVFVVGIAFEMTAPALVVVFLLPLPVIELGVRSVVGHRHPAVALDELKSYADSLLEKAKDPAVSDLELQNDSRFLQDKIFLYRSESPKVPDWYYRRNRDRIRRVLATPNP